SLCGVVDGAAEGQRGAGSVAIRLGVGEQDDASVAGSGVDRLTNAGHDLLGRRVRLPGGRGALWTIVVHAWLSSVVVAAGSSVSSAAGSSWSAKFGRGAGSGGRAAMTTARARSEE